MPIVGTPGHFRDGEAVDQHQNDDRRQRHPEHSEAEQILGVAFAGDPFESPGKIVGVPFHEHRGNLTIRLRERGPIGVGDFARRVGAPFPAEPGIELAFVILDQIGGGRRRRVPRLINLD